MATLLMQAPDVAGNERFVQAHFQAEGPSSTSNEQSVHEKTAQVGRRRSRKSKNAQKKVPQRGLGVAQLEKLRLQEQCRQEAASLEPLQPHLWPFSPFAQHESSLYAPPHSFGHPFKGGGTVQSKGQVTALAMDLIPQNPKAIHAENYGSGLISSSVNNLHVMPGMLMGCEAQNVSPWAQSHRDPAVHYEKKQFVAPGVGMGFTPHESAESEASCVSLVQDSSNLSLSASAGTSSLANQKAMHKDSVDQVAMEVYVSSAKISKNLKTVCDRTFGSSCLDRIRYMKSLKLECGEVDPRTEEPSKELRYKNPVYGSFSFDTISNVSQTNLQQEGDVTKAKGEGSSLPFILSNPLVDPTLDSTGTLHPQASHTDVPSVLFSPFGERPKELSSFQNYIGTHVWSSIEQASARKRKWLAMQVPNTLSLSSDMVDNGASLQSKVVVRKNTIPRALLVSNDKCGELHNYHNGRQIYSMTSSPVSEADSIKFLPTLSEYRNLTSLKSNMLWPERFSSFKSHAVKPAFDNPLLGRPSLDCLKHSCSLTKELPVQVGHQLHSDALTLKLSVPQYSLYPELETKEIIAENSGNPSSNMCGSTQMQSSDGDCITQCNAFTSEQTENSPPTFHKIQRSAGEVARDRHLVADSCTPVSTINSFPMYDGLTDLDSSTNVGPDGCPLDLSLKLAL